MHYVIHHCNKPQMRVGKFVIKLRLRSLPSPTLPDPSAASLLAHTELPARPPVLSLTSF